MTHLSFRVAPARALPHRWSGGSGTVPCGSWRAAPAPRRRSRYWLQSAQLRGAGLTYAQPVGRRAADAAAAAPTARVYRATCPLVGWEPLEAGLGSRFPPELALHHYVVVERLASAESSSGGGGDGAVPAASLAVVAFDFLPKDPVSPLTAAALLSGGSVPGVLRRRPLAGVPRLRCQLQGSTWLPDPHAAAEAFQQRFDARLSLLRNDCTHHADQLAAHLLGGSQPNAALQ